MGWRGASYLGGAGVAVGAVVLLASCTSTSSLPSPSATSLATTSAASAAVSPSRAVGSAKDAVTAYLRAVSGHDATTAYTFLAPQYPQDLVGDLQQFRAWVANMGNLQLTDIEPGNTDTGLDEQYPPYRDLVEYAVTYRVTFTNESDTDTSGAKTRFFVVGRSRAHNVWRILSIGTGP